MNVPTGHTVTLEPSGETFPVAVGQRLLEAARNAGFWLPFECGWGSCGTCKATLVDGDIERLFPAAPAISERDVRRSRVLLCQSSANSDLTIRPLRIESGPESGRATRSMTGTVVSSVEVGPSLFDLHVYVGEDVDFRPGQFAILQRDDGLRRCYSLAGQPGNASLRFVFKRYEGRPFSTWLSERRAGEPLALEAPYGDVWIRPAARPLVLVAGGTGISAILGLAQEAAASLRHRHLTVVYGARTMHDLVLRGELHQAVRAHQNGRLVVAVAAGPPGEGVSVGQVTDALWEVDLSEADVYLAGPPGMVDAVESMLTASNIERDRLFVDRYG